MAPPRQAQRFRVPPWRPRLRRFRSSTKPRAPFSSPPGWFRGTPKTLMLPACNTTTASFPRPTSAPGRAGYSTTRWDGKVATRLPGKARGPQYHKMFWFLHNRLWFLETTPLAVGYAILWTEDRSGTLGAGWQLDRRSLLLFNGLALVFLRSAPPLQEHDHAA